MDNLDEIVGQIYKDNKAEIERQEEIDARIPPALRFCQQCGEGLEFAEEAVDDVVEDDEYITMMSILPEEMGKIHYICGYCANHGSELSDQI